VEVSSHRFEPSVRGERIQERTLYSDEAIPDVSSATLT